MPVLLRTVSKELLEVGFTWTLAVEEPFLHGVLTPFSFQMDQIDQKLEVKYKSYIPDFCCSMGRNLCEILERYAVLEKGKVWHGAQPPCCPWTKGIGGQLPNYLVLHFFLRQDGLPTPLLHSKWTFWGKSSTTRSYCSTSQRQSLAWAFHDKFSSSTPCWWAGCSPVPLSNWTTQSRKGAH